MAEPKKTLFNPDAAEEYFTDLFVSYRGTANDIFIRDNQGRHASDLHYSAEYQKYVGMMAAMREVLEYFGKFDLGGWISVEDRLPEESGVYIVHDISMGIRVFYFGKGEVRSGWFGVTHWMLLPEPPEEEEHGTE